MPSVDIDADPTPPRDRRDVRDVGVFFALTGLLTVPVWAASAASGIEFLPGLPAAALAVVCPAIAAVALSWRRGGARAAGAILARTVDAARVRPAAWWIAILLIPPALSVAAFVILRLGDSGLPDPRIALLPTLALSAVFLTGALAEELGWTAFALGPLQARYGWLGAALLIGVVWAAWHVPALRQAHRSVSWIAWWALGAVAMRVVMVWLFNRSGGSVFGAGVFHAVSNLCWQSFPVQGSRFDPRLNGLLMAAVACAVMAAASLRPRRAMAPTRIETRP